MRKKREFISKIILDGELPNESDLISLSEINYNRGEKKV